MSDCELRTPLLLTERDSDNADHNLTKTATGQSADAATAGASINNTQQRSTTTVMGVIHACHKNIVQNLNFQLMHSLLNTAGVLPQESMPDLMRLLPPDNSGAQVNNMLTYLQYASEEQFGEFIRLLRETGKGEGGDAHLELAGLLEEKYAELKVKGNTATAQINGLEPAFVFPRTAQGPPGPPGQGHRQGLGTYCRNKWRDYNCTRWMICHCTLWAVFIFISAIGFSLLHKLPDVHHANITPKQIFAKSTIEIGLRRYHYKDWIAGITITARNCTGSVLVFRGFNSNCSDILNNSRVITEVRQWYIPVNPLYIVRGSNWNFSFGISNYFIILRSLDAYKKFLQLISNHNFIKAFLQVCYNATTTSADYWSDKVWCYANRSWSYVNHYFEISDFYYIRSSPAPPQISGSFISYNSSFIKSQASNEYMIEEKPSGSASFLISKPFEFKEENCFILNTSCPVKENIVDVIYNLVKRTDILFFPSLLFGVFILIAAFLICSQVCHTCYKNRVTDSES